MTLFKNLLGKDSLALVPRIHNGFIQSNFQARIRAVEPSEQIKKTQLKATSSTIEATSTLTIYEKNSDTRMVFSKQERMIGKQRPNLRDLLVKLAPTQAMLDQVQEENKGSFLKELIYTVKVQENVDAAALQPVLEPYRSHVEADQKRNQLTDDEMRQILSFVKGSTAFYKARDKVALLLIYSFGLRIGNIRLITKQMLSDLYKGKSVELKLLKAKNNRSLRLIPSTSIMTWFHDYKDDFEIILKNTDLAASDPFYKTRRETLTRRINSYLKEASEQLNKHLRSNSVRITVRTTGGVNLNVAKTQNVLGHENIVSTMKYDRNQTTQLKV